MAEIHKAGRVDEIRTELLNSTGRTILVIAHRGDWRNPPENSIRMGVDIVEIDIKKTKDGHLILMHDKTLDRITTGSGLVSE